MILKLEDDDSKGGYETVRGEKIPTSVDKIIDLTNPDGCQTLFLGGAGSGKSTQM